MAKSKKNISYASFNLRFIAHIVDSIFAILILSPIFFFAHKVMYSNEHNNMDLQKILSNLDYYDQEEINKLIEIYCHELLMQILVVGIIVIICWIMFKGTPGKKLLYLEVVDAKTYKKMSFMQAIIRFLGYFVSTIPLFLGFIWINFNKKRQGWHDKMAGTIVIKKEN